VVTGKTVTFTPTPAASLKPGDKAAMYNTIVEIAGDPYAEPGLLEGWVRIPMLWAGVKCAPPERADTRVLVVTT
jgi:hypothetical protein